MSGIKEHDMDAVREAVGVLEDDETTKVVSRGFR